MSSYYLIERIEEALELNQGHTAKSRRLLENWAKNDLKLLVELTEEFLPSIIGHYLQKFRPHSTRSDLATPASKPKSYNKKMNEEQLEQVLKTFSTQAEPKISQNFETPKKVKPVEWKKFYKTQKTTS